MKLPTADEIYAEYCGTCDSLPEEVLADSDLCEQVEHLMFECMTCNWWCDVSEQREDDSGQNVCSDCKDDDDED